MDEIVSRVVIIRGDRMLFIHRHKEGHEFFVLPGGHVDPGETPEVAAVREAKEETDLDVTVREHLGDIELVKKGKPKRTSLFLVDASDGEPAFVGPELEHASDSNQFVLEWHRLADLRDKTVYPEGVFEMLTERFGAQRPRSGPKFS